MSLVQTGESIDAAGLACPVCAGALFPDGAALNCAECARDYPVVAGIPDLRLGYEDAYVSWEEDLARARELAERFEELDLAGMLREHWRRSGKPVELAERFLAGDLATVGRSEAYVAEIEHQHGAPLGPADRFLEVGCGTAGLAAVARRRAGHVFATDLSMRWLVLAKKRLAEAGLQDVRLVCCGAEEPGFAPGWFDVVAASDVIEHAARQSDFVAGCTRVLRPGGMLFLATPNRYSLGLEPHVRLWGVGLLPRRLAGRYVQLVRRAPYDHVHLLSSRALRGLLESHGLEPRIVPPGIPPATRALYSGVEALMVRAYNRVHAFPPAQPVLRAVGPFFHVFARKRVT